MALIRSLKSVATQIPKSLLCTKALQAGHGETDFFVAHSFNSRIMLCLCIYSFFAVLFLYNTNISSSPEFCFKRNLWPVIHASHLKTRRYYQNRCFNRFLNLWFCEKCVILTPTWIQFYISLSFRTAFAASVLYSIQSLIIDLLNRQSSQTVVPVVACRFNISTRLIQKLLPNRILMVRGLLYRCSCKMSFTNGRTKLFYAICADRMTISSSTCSLCAHSFTPNFLNLACINSNWYSSCISHPSITLKTQFTFTCTSWSHSSESPWHSQMRAVSSVVALVTAYESLHEPLVNVFSLLYASFLRIPAMTDHVFRSSDTCIL